MNTATRLAIVGGFVLVMSGLSRNAGTAAQDRQVPAAPSAKAGATDGLVPRLRQRIPELMDQAGVHGVQIAVLRGGATAWQASFGPANTDGAEALKKVRAPAGRGER